jgi:glycerate-2-kinase
LLARVPATPASCWARQQQELKQATVLMTGKTTTTTRRTETLGGTNFKFWLSFENESFPSDFRRVVLVLPFGAIVPLPVHSLHRQPIPQTKASP